MAPLLLRRPNVEKCVIFVPPTKWNCKNNNLMFQTDFPNTPPSAIGWIIICNSPAQNAHHWLTNEAHQKKKNIYIYLGIKMVADFFPYSLREIVEVRKIEIYNGFSNHLKFDFWVWELYIYMCMCVCVYNNDILKYLNIYQYLWYIILY